MRPRPRRERRLTLGLAIPFFLSGAWALIAELCWLRALAVHIGASATALGIVLMTFMAGLSLEHPIGALVPLGRRRPLLLYALIEILLSAYISVSAFPDPAGRRRLLEILQSWATRPPRRCRGASSTSALVLLVPTSMMVRTTPLLIAATTERSGGHRFRRPGWL